MSTYSAKLIALFALIFIPISHTEAQSWTNAPSLAGFEDPTAVGEQAGRSGLPVPGGIINVSSPVIAELDGNPQNGKELVAASADGYVHAYRSDGSRLWTTKTPNYQCGGLTNRVHSSPAVGDLLGDGNQEVVIGYGGISIVCPGGVVALQGKTGRQIWHFSLPRWAKKANFRERLYGVWSTPALSDVDGDGKLEIAFGGFDRRLYLLNADGKVRWFLAVADTVFSSPSFFDIDGDKKEEMIAATDISQNRFLRPPTKNGGILYALSTAPKSDPINEYPFRSSRVVKWLTPLDQVLYGSPTIADVDPKNSGSEIIQASGCFFPERTTKKVGTWVKIASAKNGQIIRTFPIPTCSATTPAVGDLNEDGNLDVVVTVNGYRPYGGDGRSRLIAIDVKNRRRLWTTIITEPEGHNDLAGNFMSPVIADVDGNGSLEVLASNLRTVGIYEGKTGTILTCADRSCSNGSTTILRTKGGGRPIKTSPAVGDLNGDGLLEVVVGANVGSANPDQGALYVWTGLAGLINSSPGLHEPYATPWSQFKGSETRAGRR